MNYMNHYEVEWRGEEWGRELARKVAPFGSEGPALAKKLEKFRRLDRQSCIGHPQSRYEVNVRYPMGSYCSNFRHSRIQSIFGACYDNIEASGGTWWWQQNEVKWDRSDCLRLDLYRHVWEYICLIRSWHVGTLWNMGHRMWFEHQKRLPFRLDFTFVVVMSLYLDYASFRALDCLYWHCGNDILTFTLVIAWFETNGGE